VVGMHGPSSSQNISLWLSLFDGIFDTCEIFYEELMYIILNDQPV